MSRTYRGIRYRQHWHFSIESVLREHAVKDFDDTQVSKVTNSRYYWWGDETHYDVVYRKDSKEGKKRLARYRSDIGTARFKEPGPSWFRNIFTERPQRREAKRQLQQFFKDPDFEVILNSKDPLEYWT